MVKGHHIVHSIYMYIEITYFYHYSLACLLHPQKQKYQKPDIILTKQSDIGPIGVMVVVTPSKNYVLRVYL